jgi:hypothetical protein
VQVFCSRPNPYNTFAVKLAILQLFLVSLYRLGPLPKFLELFHDSVFLVSIGWYVLGILPTNTKEKLGWYISVL